MTQSSTSIDERVKVVQPTILDADVFDGVGVPQLFVLITVTHEREDNLLDDNLKHGRIASVIRQDVNNMKIWTPAQDPMY